MRIRIRLTDVDGGQEYLAEDERNTLADAIAFEHHFKMSSTIVDLASARAEAYLAEVEVAKEAGEPEPEPPDNVFPRNEWTLFFAWRKLGRHHPELRKLGFVKFIDAIDEVEFMEDEPAEGDGADNELDDEEKTALQAEAVALNDGDGSLDPPDPDRQPTSQPSSSSTASAGRT